MILQVDIEGNEKKFLHTFANFSNKRVLEIGCGEGRLTRQHLKDKVFFTQARAQTMPFPNESFDSAVLAWSLCCIEPQGKPDALKEIRPLCTVLWSKIG